jgi:hypothetical protein
MIWSYPPKSELILKAIKFKDPQFSTVHELYVCTDDIWFEYSSLALITVFVQVCGDVGFSVLPLIWPQSNYMGKSAHKKPYVIITHGWDQHHSMMKAKRPKLQCF